ncbi:sulfite exporter TauE/SafE family protein [bacterium]|nr:sulfite exporter TauE/SafE family protein [bacterium]
MDMANIALLLGIGAAAGFINVNAGGGSSLTLPALIFMGLDGVMANGTNRIAIFIQNIFAMSSFHKNKVYQYKTSLKYSLLTLPGAIAGAVLAVQISGELFQKILAVVLIFIVLSLFISRSYKKRTPLSPPQENWLIYPALIGIGFYGGFLQIGVGFMFMAALYHLLRLNLIWVNMHKVFIILIYTIPALMIFTLTSHVNWTYGLILAGGNSLGAWWGAHAAVKGGEKVIRIVLAAAITIMALKLLGLF